MNKTLITTTSTEPHKHGCSCKFPMEDKHGKYQGSKAHTNWSLYKQDHDNPEFAEYLQCNGCGYQLAKKYWEWDTNNIESKGEEN